MNSITLNNSGQLQVSIDNATAAGVSPATAATKLDDLADVMLVDEQSDDRLVYNEETGHWENQDNIDGGAFTR